MSGLVVDSMANAVPARIPARIPRGPRCAAGMSADITALITTSASRAAGGRAFGGDRPQRGHRVESVPHYVEDNDTVVGAQEMGDHTRSHVTKANKTDCC
jgi:hypothetical protein